MGFQCRNGAEIARQIGLAQGGVDFIVADLVQQHRLAALPAAQFRDKVVQALLGLGRDRTVAERADGIGVHDGEMA